MRRTGPRGAETAGGGSWHDRGGCKKGGCSGAGAGRGGRRARPQAPKKEAPVRRSRLHDAANVRVRALCGQQPDRPHGPRGRRARGAHTGRECWNSRQRRRGRWRRRGRSALVLQGAQVPALHARRRCGHGSGPQSAPAVHAWRSGRRGPHSGYGARGARKAVAGRQGRRRPVHGVRIPDDSRAVRSRPRRGARVRMRPHAVVPLCRVRKVHGLPDRLAVPRHAPER